MHDSRPGEPGRRGRAAARRRDHQLQRHRGHRLGPAPGADPGQRRRRGGHRLPARRRRAHRRPPTRSSSSARPPRTPTSCEAGRLPRHRPVDATWCTGGPLYTTVQMGYTAEQTVEALIRLPQRVWGVAKAIVGLQDRDPDSPVSIVGGSRLAGETVSLEGFPLDREGRLPADADRRLQLLHRRCSTSSRCCRSTAATSPARSGRPYAAASPGCAAGPTPATSTSPGCCRSPTSMASFMLVDERGADRRRPRRTPAPADVTPPDSDWGRHAARAVR